ncbi:MAG: hypothetical protein WHV66_05915 [Anaerolineales bacterium]
MQRHRPLHYYVIFMFTLLIAGCVNGSSTPTSTPKPPTRTSLPTFTRAPTITPLPTQTSLPTLAPSATSTPYPTPAVDFSKATFYTGGFLPGWRFFIAVQAEEEVKGNYNAVLQDEKGKSIKQYTCTVIPKYPKRLYCSGDLPGMEKWFTYTIFDQTSGQPVYSGRIYIPLFQRYSSAP